MHYFPVRRAAVVLVLGSLLCGFFCVSIFPIDSNAVAPNDELLQATREGPRDYHASNSQSLPPPDSIATCRGVKGCDSTDMRTR